MSQGANPWSDVGCEQALRLVGLYLQRAVGDANDLEARSQMMYAATLAGIAFGNAGVHIPHAMSYSVAGMVRSFLPEGYPQGEPMVPHGMSVIVNAPAVFQFTANACPARHLRGAELLGADIRGADSSVAGDLLADHLVNMMRTADMPNGVGGVGYDESDVPGLADGALLQQRLLNNAPRATDRDSLRGIYRGAMRYW
jgi:alcohol dehydrogenase class IV